MTNLLTIPGITWYGLLTIVIVFINGGLQFYGLCVSTKRLGYLYYAVWLASVALAGLSVYLFISETPCAEAPIFDLGVTHSDSYLRNYGDATDHGLACATRSMHQYMWGCLALLCSCICTSWCIYRHHIVHTREHQSESIPKNQGNNTNSARHKTSRS